MGNGPFIVSACLVGMYCRYDGQIQGLECIQELVRRGDAIPFCPEVYGGLPTPRPPCEVQAGHVFDIHGKDRTQQFVRGAKEGLRLAKLLGCKEAILKSHSPSCGKGQIYDGSFSGIRIPGNGLFAALLERNGIQVRTEHELDAV